jgi:hypothetical protein
MSQRNLIFGIILLLLVFISHASFAHSIFDPNGNVPGRTTTVLKTGPCGGIARTATNKMLLVGSAVRVDWLETIQHPGRFEFYLSTANDANFTLIATVPDDQDNPNNLPHVFNAMVTLPAGVTCDNCTLQMIQVMTEVPTAPTYYYSCADISIQSSIVVTPSPLPTPAPATGPSSANCH